MKTARRSQRAPGLQPSFSLVAATFLGLLGATLAFSHAAAQIGLPLNVFRPLGGSFFSWRAGQFQLAMEVGRNGAKREKLPLIKMGRQGLLNAPLSPRALWFIGLEREARGDRAGARGALETAEKLTRREGSVQIWLAGDALRRGDVNPGLRHFDIVLRTNPATAQEILPRLSMAALAPDGRAALKPYMRADNPWISQFLLVAVDRLPRAAPMGLLLSEKGISLPDTPMAREAYSALTRRLAAENSYDVFGRVYPKLPGAEAASLKGLGLSYLMTTGRGYAPAIWDLGTSSDRGGAPVSLDAKGVGIEFFAAPSTVGIAGSKLMMRGDRRALRWAVVDRTVNSDATARWIATCVGAKGDGASRSSNDLTRLPVGKPFQFDLPANCPMIRLDFRFSGGTGRQSSSIIVGDLALVAGPERSGR